MTPSYQSILLVDQVADAIECILETCDRAELPPVKFSTAFSLDYALRLLDEREFSLLVVAVKQESDLRSLSELSSKHSPKPLIVLLDDCISSLVLPALRAGASDIFIASALVNEGDAFIHSVCRGLSLSESIETNQQVRDELELSLSELQADQQAARQIQQNMLPPTKTQVAGLQIEHLLIPSLFLSGDFVDVVPLDANRVMFYLADVSGHGASSALVTVLLKNMANRLQRNFRRGSSFDVLSPIDTLDRINAELLDTDLGKHLSIFIGLYDQQEGTLTYAVGGHHPMPILKDSSGCRFLEGRGMPVGLLPEPLFDQRKLELNNPFSMTMFTDGILEVMSESSMAEKERRLLEAVSETKDADPETIKAALLPAIISDAPDDIAIMTISRQ